MQGQFQKAAPEPLVAGYRAGANAPCHRRQFVWSCRPMGRIQGGQNLGRGLKGRDGPMIVGRRGRECPLLSAAISPRDGPFQGGRDPWAWVWGCENPRLRPNRARCPKRTNRAGVKRGRVALAPSRCARPHFLSSAVRAHLVSVSKGSFWIVLRELLLSRKLHALRNATAEDKRFGI